MLYKLSKHTEGIKATFLSSWFWVYAQSLKLCLFQKMDSLDSKMEPLIEILLVLTIELLAKKN